jgi:hypothetical protein
VDDIREKGGDRSIEGRLVGKGLSPRAEGTRTSPLHHGRAHQDLFGPYIMMCIHP